MYRTEYEISEYVDAGLPAVDEVYNERRLHSALGDLRPALFNEITAPAG